MKLGISRQRQGWTIPLALGAAVMFFAAPLGNAERSAVQAGSYSTSADPAVVGQWSTPFQPSTQAVGVHAVVMRSGKVLLMGLRGIDYPPYPALAYVWDPATNAIHEVDAPDNSFCSGLTVLSDGTVLMAGGKVNTPGFTEYGLPNVYTFDPDTETWARQPDMTAGRFYPTSTELLDGRVIETSGNGATGPINNTTTVYTPATPQGMEVTTPSNGPFTTTYPRQYVMPDGKVLSIEYQKVHLLDTSASNPAQWTWSSLPSMTSYHGAFGPGNVRLPEGPSGSTRIMVVGGAAFASKNTVSAAETFDYAQPTSGWSSLAPLPQPRDHMNSVLLPDGTVLGVGGNSQYLWDVPQYQTLLYNPSTNAWSGLASQQVVRGYHSTAVLLPDGRVLSAGSTNPGQNGGKLEIYSPPYLFQGARPTIVQAPDRVQWGQSFSIQTAGAISRAVLMAPAAVTHNVDMHQLHLELAITPAGGGVTAVAPKATIAPPGWYMLFVLNSAHVPSIAHWIHVGGAAPVVSNLGSASGLTSGGNSVTISGSGFNSVTGVRFGHIGTTFTVNSDSQITATAPPGVGTVDVTVFSPIDTSVTTPADSYSYSGPWVAGLSRSFGPAVGGTTLTINGSGLTGATAVTFGGKPATFSVVSDSQIRTKAPSGTGLVDVQVTTGIGTSPIDRVPTYDGGQPLGDPFNYAPSIVSRLCPSCQYAVFPRSAAVGSTVTIYGNNFLEATGVFFDTKPATSYTIVSDTTIKAVVPTPDQGGHNYMVDITLSSPGGTSATSFADSFVYP